jgi:CRP-like cAMP-binding protein
MATTGISGLRNRLLVRLPEAEYDRLVPLFEPVTLAPKQLLHQINHPLMHVYFPLRGMFSLMIFMEDGKQVEVASVGHEGMIGLSVALGVGFELHQAVCLAPSESLRLPSRTFQDALIRSPQLDVITRRYAAASLRQAEQLAACNVFHPLQERMARWLLMTHDRAEDGRFPLTHESLAQALGVRRQTVTDAAGVLQAAGLIAYRRGGVQVTNRPGLEDAACECYGAMKAQYDAFLK